MDTKRTRKEVVEMHDAFAKRRQMFMDGLDEIPGLSYSKPYGAFYIMVDVSGLGMTSSEFSQKLLAKPPENMFVSPTQHLMKILKKVFAG